MRFLIMAVFAHPDIEVTTHSREFEYSEESLKDHKEEIIEELSEGSPSFDETYLHDIIIFQSQPGGNSPKIAVHWTQEDGDFDDFIDDDEEPTSNDNMIDM